MLLVPMLFTTKPKRTIESEVSIIRQVKHFIYTGLNVRMQKETRFGANSI